jgi:DNA-binding XRE family transcriptional regulator
MRKQFKNFNTLKKKWAKNPKFRRAYKKLEVEDRLIRALIEKRLRENLTQKELARKIGATQSAISRFELGQVSPRLEFIQKVAKGVGARIEVS